MTMLSLTVFLGVLTAAAQSASRVTAEIPFDFNVGNMKMDAGTYDIKIIRSLSGSAAVTFINETGEVLETVFGTLNGKVSTGNSWLVFERAGTGHALSDIAMPDSGISIPISAQKRRLGVTVSRNDRVVLPIANIN